MYETHTDALLPAAQFLRRLARHGVLAGLVLLLSLLIGTIGFHWLVPQPWLDAFLNAAMLLGGMGPVGNFERPAGKLFAALYALYSGIVFLGATAVFLAPVVHRIVHRFHLSEQRTRRPRVTRRADRDRTR